MKTINILLFTFLLILSLASCSSYTISQEEYNTLAEKYYLLESSQEDVLSYYESLCDSYGYLTYDMVKNPEKWRYYLQGDIEHLDWLCGNLDRDDHYLSTVAPFSGSTLDGTDCSLCYLEDKDFFFLDPNTEVFHRQKSCLLLKTEDFISPEIVYRFVFYDSAIKTGYTPCPECLNT